LTTCFASCHLPNRQRDGHPDRLENLPAGPEAFTPYGERLAPVFYSDLLEGLEVLLDVGPFETVTGFLQPAAVPGTVYLIIDLLLFLPRLLPLQNTASQLFHPL